MFVDRRDAGRRLAEALARRGYPSPTVLALPRGGVVVAAEVAARLGCPLGVLVVRKLRAPMNPELAIGAVAAVADHPIIVLGEEGEGREGVSKQYLDEEVATQLAEVRRQAAAYGCGPSDLAGRTAIVVDDGIATGATARTALRALRQLGPARLVVAAPVAAPESCEALGAEADEVAYLEAPRSFHAVGAFYHDFSQTTDAEVLEILGDARRRTFPAGGPA